MKKILNHKNYLKQIKQRKNPNEKIQIMKILIYIIIIITDYPKKPN